MGMGKGERGGQRNCSSSSDAALVGIAYKRTTSLFYAGGSCFSSSNSSALVVGPGVINDDGCMVPLQGRRHDQPFPPKRKRLSAQAFAGFRPQTPYSRCADGKRRMRLGLKLGRTDGLAGLYQLLGGKDPAAS